MIYTMFKEIFYWNNLHAFSLDFWYGKQVVQVTGAIELNHEAEFRPKIKFHKKS